MKKAVILLAIICVALLAAMILRSQRAGNQLEFAVKEISGISNQLSESQMKLNHQERMNAALKTQVEERESVIARFSNDLAQAHSGVVALRAEQQTAREEIGKCTERGNAIAAERSALSNQIGELNGGLRDFERQLRAAHEREFAAETNLAVLSQQFAAVQLEKQRLDALITDPGALRAQLESARRAQVAAQTPRPGGKADYRYAARLEPDGSVTLTPPPFKKPATN